jgi:hypothetical protein
MVAALVMSHIRLGETMLWWIIDQHELDFREAKVLAKIVKATAAKQNLHLADGPIRVPGTLNQHLGFSAILYTQFPRGLPGVVWNCRQLRSQVSAGPIMSRRFRTPMLRFRTRSLTNGRIKINRPPYSCVIGGNVRDVLPVKSCAEAASMPNPPLAAVVPFN